MGPDRHAVADTLVTAVEIARIAKVTRAAVSNWRRRYPDFPAPAGGTDRNPLFALADVDSWLAQHDKGTEVSPEVLLWQELRGTYGDDMIRGLADVGEFLVSGSSDALAPALRSSVRELADQSTPAEVVEGLTERLVGSGRMSADQTVTPQLVRAVRFFAGRVTGTVFDPACGIGSLLLAIAGDSAAAGQEINTEAARLASARARLRGLADVTIMTGDSLRDDQWKELRAELVVCNPPVNVTDWGRDELLLDPRWEFGAPTRAEGELAWLQHSYAHVGPGGRLIVVMPASAAYRKAGRRIRAELVRRAALTQVVALPAGMAASHSQAVHLWLLTRPSGTEPAGGAVRMVDLSDNDPEGPFDPTPAQVTDVPLIDLLDDEVDLTPARHVSAVAIDHVAEYAAACEATLGRLEELRALLPHLAPGPGALDGATVRVSELARAGLVEVSDGDVLAASDHLDADFLRGFLRSAANIRRSTSGSGSFRADVRGSRIPQMGIDDQRRYGAAFRALDEFERHLADLAKQGERAASLARDGLTQGALRPDQQRPR
ncbi:N-6 DNA methylase [Pseudonocardia hierapolitana]|uniref:N-6 DNA methylase n=1 Tax=Pseudonocardia hierapolitana TaxID=1128676 RepID=A0A561SLE4_9PSEU|nr:N-6 DNA methylase [Pseudonocardia hierapolitana]TWF75642.1 N-6 DNA methylase [Pseudonocardia hierapolitana]